MYQPQGYQKSSAPEPASDSPTSEKLSSATTDYGREHIKKELPATTIGGASLVECGEHIQLELVIVPPETQKHTYSKSQDARCH